MGQDSLVFLIKELLHMDALLCQIYLQLLVVALVKDVIRMVNKSVGDCSSLTDPCHLKPGQLPYCPANGASGDGCVR